MYIKLTFVPESLKYPHVGSALMQTLLKEPEIVPDIPSDAKVGRYNKVSHNNSEPKFFADAPQLTYFFDCSPYNSQQTKEALHLFKKHYGDYEQGLPAVYVGREPKENEIINNLQVALDNLTKKPEDQEELKGKYESRDELWNNFFS
ncbi:MAG: hypothetical protein QM652_11780 [Legionella sp.]|uniref:hypothetical protein n=1 Tax=Legionella sp. TaxID=459 RepID=UPI0039E6ED1F